MRLTDVLAKVPTGLYVLTGNGELGVFDAQQDFLIDESLSRVFAEHNRAFLRSHIQDPQADDRRVAILYESLEPNAWGHLMLSLEDLVVRFLYPAGGRSSGELTAFQKNSRKKSVYRGVELLLDFRHDNALDVPVFCPVLFNPHSTLSGRVSALGREPNKTERDIPVLDLLNLIAIIPPARRASSAVLELVDKLRQGVIHKEQRRNSQFSVQDDVPYSQAPGSGEDAYTQIARDKRLGRSVTLPSVDERRLHETEHVEPVERWLKIPHQPVSPERLRTFVQFRKLGNDDLAELTARSLIYTAPAGTRLLDRGLHDAWNLYLLEGALMLMPADGATLRVDGGTDKAAYPVAFLKPRKYTVETLTPVSFLWVHDLLLEALLGNSTLPAS